MAPEAGNDRILVTPAPLPLTRFGTGSRLQADDAATPAVSEEVLLPAPEANPGPAPERRMVFRNPRVEPHRRT